MDLEDVAEAAKVNGIPVDLHVAIAHDLLNIIVIGWYSFPMKHRGDYTMLLLVPPSLVEAKKIEEFRQEFLNAQEKIHGGEGLRKCESAERWLNERPWLAWPNSYQFFTVDRETWEIIGCIRLTTMMTAPAIKQGAFNLGHSIRPSQRRKGYGTQQLRLGLAYLKDLGCTPVMLAVDKANLASREIIFKFNYTVVFNAETYTVYTILF